MERVIKILEIKNLSKSYGTIKALHNINLKVRSGEIFGIIGPSGAGKSTLIRTVNLLEKPDRGSILLHGEDLAAYNDESLRQKRRKIGMIFQHFNLLHNRTVRANISFPLEIAGVSGKEKHKKVDKLMELVDLSDRANHYPGQLSGGQKQRVGIARALANDPELLLSDEATSSLDPESTEDILELLARIRDELNLTILLITHEMEVIKQVCDRVAVMKEGRIIERGDVIDVFARPRKGLTRRFIKSIIDFDLPAGLFANHPDGLLVRLSFIGKKTHEPLISSLVRKYEIDANILYGRIDDIQSIPFGTLIVKLEGDINKALEGIEYLKAQNLAVEVLESGSINKI